MPAGALVTVPGPLLVTVRVLEARMKTAFTCQSSPTTGRLHVGDVDPTQEPSQCPNAHPGSGVAVNVTYERSGTSAARHVDPQSSPVGLLVTRPLPSLRMTRYGLRQLTLAWMSR